MVEFDHDYILPLRSFGGKARYLTDLAAAERPGKGAAAANLETAEALGITLTLTTLGRADRVIE